MQKAEWQSEILLLLAAAIWGFAFVAQRLGMEHVGPFIFNAVRFALGSLSLIPFLRTAAKPGAEFSQPTMGQMVRGGALAGVALFAGASLQQIGIVYTTAGKAGFITGLYVVLVPLLGLFLKIRPGPNTWLGALCATAGLYFLSISGNLEIAPGDALVLTSALFWAIHVILIGRLSARLGWAGLAFLQFSVCSALSFVAALLTEEIALAGILDAALPILYGGLLSVGVAYTLQVVGQRRAPPAHAAIILSLETVFAALGGWLILDEILSLRSLFGCALMLTGILVSQLSPDRRRSSA